MDAITQLSRGATKCLHRLRWYASQHTRVFPRQKKLAEGLNVTDRQLRRYLHELQGFCTDQCPDHCDGDGAPGHIGLIDVRQGGDGRSASYVLTGALPRVNVRADVRPNVRADVQAETGPAVAQPSPDAPATEENVRAERPPIISSSCSSCSSHSRTEQHYSPVVNDADSGEKPSLEAETKNPKPGSGGNPSPAFDTEVAEIREALKARPLVRLTAAFDPVIRQMLASGETVEIIKRAILRGCWLKLARRDRGDMSLIFSMCYFLNVIADVKPMADPAYWRSFEQRLGREEQKRLSQQTASDGREHEARPPVSAPCRPPTEESPIRMPGARGETSVPTVAAIQHQMSELAAQKGLGWVSRRG